MIIKSKGMPIKATEGVLKYIVRDGSQLLDNRGRPLLIKQHLRGNDVSEWTREFIVNESKRRRKNKRARGLYHVILSLHPKDSDMVTFEMLGRFARHFLQLRCPNSLAVVTAHMDEHIHLHFALSGVQIGSHESIRIERGGFVDILKGMEEFQEREFPELQFSKVNFEGKSLGRDAEYQMKAKGTVPEKQLIMAYATAALETSQSEAEFIEQLRIQGFEAYFRNGKLSGVQGIRRYRFKTIGVSLERFSKDIQEISGHRR
jgi:hypothetical protein